MHFTYFVVQLYLNRQVITLLSTLGVEDSVFLDLQERALQQLADNFLIENNLSKELEKFFPGISRLQEVQPSYKLASDSFLRQVLKEIYLDKLFEMTMKSRIPIEMEHGRLLMGTIDETDSLQEDEVFIKITNMSTDGSKSKVTITGQVVVTKNPCLHPGDIRILKAVQCSSLSHMVDCIVFPVKGNRPIPDQIAGSDLDGDMYWTCWLPDLIPPRGNVTPMHFDKREARCAKEPIRSADLVDYFVDHIRYDVVGLIANAHLTIADQENDGACNEKCLKLAQLHSDAVDYPKTGYYPKNKITSELRQKRYPDFLQKHWEPMYISQKILGHLYHQCVDISNEIQSKSLLLLDTENCSSFSLFNDLFSSVQFDEYKQDVCTIIKRYEIQVEDMLLMYHFSNEAQLIIGSKRTSHTLGFTDKNKGDLVDIIREQMTTLKEKTRNAFLQNFSKMDFSEQKKKLAALFWVACESRFGKGLIWFLVDKYYILLDQHRLNSLCNELSAVTLSDQIFSSCQNESADTRIVLEQIVSLLTKNFLDSSYSSFKLPLNSCFIIVIKAKNVDSEKLLRYVANYLSNFLKKKVSIQFIGCKLKLQFSKSHCNAELQKCCDSDIIVTCDETILKVSMCFVQLEQICPLSQIILEKIYQQISCNEYLYRDELQLAKYLAIFAKALIKILLDQGYDVLSTNNMKHIIILVFKVCSVMKNMKKLLTDSNYSLKTLNNSASHDESSATKTNNLCVIYNKMCFLKDEISHLQFTVLHKWILYTYQAFVVCGFDVRFECGNYSNSKNIKMLPITDKAQWRQIYPLSAEFTQFIDNSPGSFKRWIEKCGETKVHLLPKQKRDKDFVYEIIIYGNKMSIVRTIKQLELLQLKLKNIPDMFANFNFATDANCFIVSGLESVDDMIKLTRYVGPRYNMKTHKKNDFVSPTRKYTSVILLDDMSILQRTEYELFKQHWLQCYHKLAQSYDTNLMGDIRIIIRFGKIMWMGQNLVDREVKYKFAVNKLKSTYTHLAKNKKVPLSVSNNTDMALSKQNASHTYNKRQNTQAFGNTSQYGSPSNYHYGSKPSLDRSPECKQNLNSQFNSSIKHKQLNYQDDWQQHYYSKQPSGTHGQNEHFYKPSYLPYKSSSSVYLTEQQKNVGQMFDSEVRKEVSQINLNKNYGMPEDFNNDTFNFVSKPHTLNNACRPTSSNLSPCKYSNSLSVTTETNCCSDDMNISGTSFHPCNQECPGLEKFLNKNDFQRFSSDKKCICALIAYERRTQVELLLNENLEHLYFRLPPVRFCDIQVKTADAAIFSKPDIRIQVNTVRSLYNLVDEDHEYCTYTNPGIQLLTFKDNKHTEDFINRNIVVDLEFERKIRHIRLKDSSTYRLNPHRSGNIKYCNHFDHVLVEITKVKEMEAYDYEKHLFHKQDIHQEVTIVVPFVPSLQDEMAWQILGKDLFVFALNLASEIKCTSTKHCK